LIFGLAFIIGAFLYLKEGLIIHQNFYPALMIGYTVGIFEKMITLRLSRFTFKIVFSIGLMISKIAIFPVLYLSQSFALAIQASIVILSMIADLLKEKEDRKTFKRFYDYRESHTKFRNLMVSGLPANILIISRDLRQKLFANQCLENTLSREINSVSKSQIGILHEWLGNLKIDYNSLKELEQSFGSYKELLPVSVFDLLKYQEKKEDLLLLIPDQKFTFNAEHNQKIYEINISSIVWDRQDAVAVILNDVTVHSLNQSLKLADSNKDRMLAMVSHELRTPLNGILGVVKILRKQTKDPQTLQYLSICKSSGELLYNLVNSILDLQQIRDRKFSLKIFKDDLHQLLKDVQSLFRFQFEEKSLYINLEIDPKVPQYVATDHNRLRQILINLIGNALKFTFEGGVLIFVEMDLEEKNCMKFSIEDTGIGIKEEDQSKLFKMYGRLDQADPKTNTQGVGFGLEISNQLARLLGGSAITSGIRFTSQYGKGTKFSFLMKDYTTNSQDVDDLEYFDPQTFEEDVENLSLKLSPYSLHSICSTDRDQSQKSSSPVVSKHATRNSNGVLLCPISPSQRTRKKFRASTHGRRPSQVAPKSKFQQNHSYEFLKCETPVGSSAFQIKDGACCEVRLFPSPKHKESPSNSLKNQIMKNILIIDDNPFNLLIAKNLVEGLGYQVETALNGQLGINLVKSLASNNKKPFEAILMDIQMPVMDGYEATKALKEMMSSHEMEEIPIIALSANDSEDDKAKSKEVGMYEHLPKPLKEAQLKMVLEKLVEKDVSLGTLYDVDS